MSLRRIASALLVLFAIATQAQQQPTISRKQTLQRVQEGVTALQRWYVQRTGLYQTTGWWNSANAITVLVDAMRTGLPRSNESILTNTLTQAQIVVPKSEQTGELEKMTGAPNFLNEFYDDEGWWAMAWIDAYDLTGKPQYLAAAQTIFRDMQGAWDNTCGGGIWWSKKRHYKNAIANELFFDVSASLARRGTRADKAEALAWATKEWTWFQSTGMINSDHLVNDGLEINKEDGTCHNNKRTVWTYNQGVVLGALSEYARATHSSQPLTDARTLADAGLAHLTDNDGILHDPCEPKCGNDANQFKGIFVRNLRILNRTLHEPRYRTFFATNANSIWLNARTDKDELGVRWSGPPAELNAGTQVSALDALVAAAADR
jgi:predicted alpha-1,6-mannanase (GH76 family)